MSAIFLSLLSFSLFFNLNPSGYAETEGAEVAKIKLLASKAFQGIGLSIPEAQMTLYFQEHYVPQNQALGGSRIYSDQSRILVLDNSANSKYRIAYSLNADGTSGLNYIFFGPKGSSVLQRAAFMLMGKPSSDFAKLKQKINEKFPTVSVTWTPGETMMLISSSPDGKLDVDKLLAHVSSFPEIKTYPENIVYKADQNPVSGKLIEIPANQTLIHISTLIRPGLAPKNVVRKIKTGTPSECKDIIMKFNGGGV